MITIYAGCVIGGTGLTDIVLARPHDYPSVRVAIRDAINHKKPVAVYVLDRVCDLWFWDLADYPGVEIIDNSPCAQLRRAWNVVGLPQELEHNPELITTLALLDLPKPTPGTDIWAWVLSHLVGPAWCEKEPSFAHLTTLVNWFAGRGPSDSATGILATKRHEAEHRWISSATTSQKSAYDWLLSDPIPRAKGLVALSYLRDKYSGQLDQWLLTGDMYSTGGEWIEPQLGASTLRMM